MKTVAVCMVKDELDIIPYTLNNMLNQVDSVIVADNLSTDGTTDFLYNLASQNDRLIVAEDSNPAYLQSEKMTALALHARLEHGADWVVPWDADEIWYSPFGLIKEVLGALAPQWLVATAAMYDHVTSSKDDLTEMNPVKRIGWRRSYPGMLPKVACRWREDLIIQQGNHGASYSGGVTLQEGLLVIRHYPYRSHQQFIQKVINGVAAYAATDLPEHAGRHWKDYGNLLKAGGERVLEEVYDMWFHLGGDPNLLPDVIYDPAPIY